MPLKIEQGSTISITDGIKIANNSIPCYVGETVYFARGYDYPNTNELTNHNSWYTAAADTTVIDKFSKGGTGFNNGYKIPFTGYYCFAVIANVFECPFAEHYSARVQRFDSSNIFVREYAVGNVIAPVTFWTDVNSIVNLPLSMSAFHTDLLNVDDTLVVSVKRDRHFLDKYYQQNSGGSNFEYEANDNTKASFNFQIRISIVNPGPA